MEINLKEALAEFGLTLRNWQLHKRLVGVNKVHKQKTSIIYDYVEENPILIAPIINCIKGEKNLVCIIIIIIYNI